MNFNNKPWVILLTVLKRLQCCLSAMFLTIFLYIPRYFIFLILPLLITTPHYGFKNMTIVSSVSVTNVFERYQFPRRRIILLATRAISPFKTSPTSPTAAAVVTIVTSNWSFATRLKRTVSFLYIYIYILILSLIRDRNSYRPFLFLIKRYVTILRNVSRRKNGSHVILYVSLKKRNYPVGRL